MEMVKFDFVSFHPHSPMSLSEGLGYPLLLVGGVVGSVLGHNAYSYWLYKTLLSLKSRSSRSRPSLFGILVTGGLRSQADADEYDKLTSSPTLIGSLSPFARAPLMTLFLLSGIVVGAWPGFLLRWEMDSVKRFEAEFQDTFHLTRLACSILGIITLASYYMFLLFIVIRSFKVKAAYRQGGATMKKKRKEYRQVKKEKARLLELLNPKKYHRALKVYEKEVAEPERKRLLREKKYE